MNIRLSIRLVRFRVRRPPHIIRNVTHPIGHLDRETSDPPSDGAFQRVIKLSARSSRSLRVGKVFFLSRPRAAAGEIRWTANNSARIFFPVSLKKHAFRSRFRQTSLSSCREGSLVASARARAIYRSPAFRSTASTPNRVPRFGEIAKWQKRGRRIAGARGKISRRRGEFVDTDGKVNISARRARQGDVPFLPRQFFPSQRTRFLLPHP